MRSIAVVLPLLLGSALVVGCSCGGDAAPPADGSVPPGTDAPATGIDAPGTDAPRGDGFVPSPDVLTPSGCVPGSTQCSDCIDNDGDGLADGFDPECTSAADLREDSFATGIPGDNIDLCNQDCFFDGNSGQGDDGCNINICCLVSSADCPASCAGSFNPSLCTPSARCTMNCEGITTPGCDCFGCCTMCDDTGCYDVITNPTVAPDCDYASIADPASCPRCTPSADCGTPCNPSGCILCPGMTPDDLPPDCMMMSSCPGGAASCATTADCGPDQYCSVGCCIDSLI